MTGNSTHYRLLPYLLVLQGFSTVAKPSSKWIFIFSTFWYDSLCQVIPEVLGQNMWLIRPLSCQCERRKFKYIISPWGNYLLVRPLKEYSSDQSQSEKWKEENREGEELPSEVHMCIILVFLCMITFFHHQDVSHVARAWSCSLCGRFCQGLANVLLYERNNYKTITSVWLFKWRTHTFAMP